jgi:hypothetical protein
MQGSSAKGITSETKVLAQKTQSSKEAPNKEAGVKIVGISVVYNEFAKNLMIENSSLNSLRKLKQKAVEANIIPKPQRLFAVHWRVVFRHRTSMAGRSFRLWVHEIAF